jgi:hypothetical protein
MSVRKKLMNVKNTATIQLVATCVTVLGQAIAFTVMAILVKVSLLNTVIINLLPPKILCTIKMSMNVLRVLTIVLRSVQTQKGVMSAPVLPAIS